MRRSKSRQEEDAKIDITPMLDVVFIMLIFFIVTASFIKESGAKVTKPSAENSNKYPRASVLLAIDDNNEIWLDRRVIDPRAIKANISRVMAENPEGKVIIQADVEAEAKTVLEVVDKLREANIPVATISTKSE